MLAGAGFLTLFSISVEGYTGGNVALTVAVIVALTGLGLRLVARPDAVAGMELVLLPPVLSLMIAAQNYITRDPSGGAQIFYLWPVLYAALFLNVTQGILTLVIASGSNATVLWFLRPGAPGITDATSMSIAFTMALVVVTVLKRRNQALVREAERIATEDELTRLGNRRRLHGALDHAVAQSHRDGSPVSLITLDVDGFKHINDSRGHAGGDAVLVSIATALRAAVRRDDVVVRLGGDEFLVVLPGCPSTDATRVAEEIRDMVSREVAGVTVSMGVATAEAGQLTPDAIVRLSDDALYRAKAGGRDRVVASAAA